MAQYTLIEHLEYVKLCEYNQIPYSAKFWCGKSLAYLAKQLCSNLYFNTVS